MVDEVYPFLDSMCRLCLKENGANISIFSAANPKERTLSIPIRIMSCAALEVQENDNLPKAICTDCRYQLEKSFYFRKRSQNADTKLRKHLRLLSLGKRSRVFTKNEEYEDDDELEFEDSIRFIREHEDEQKEQLKAEQNEMVKKLRPMLSSEIRKEFNIELEEKIYPEMRQEIEANLRKELRVEVKNEVKQELRNEIEAELRETMLPTLKEECREDELNSLLNDLETFLRDKRAKIENDCNKQDQQSTLLFNMTELRDDQDQNKPKQLKRKSPKKHVYCAKQMKIDIGPFKQSKTSANVAEHESCETTTTLEFENCNTESNSGVDEHDNDSNNYYIIDDQLDEDVGADDTDDGQANSALDEHEQEQENDVHGGNDDVNVQQGEREDDDEDDAMIVNELNTDTYRINENNSKRTVSYHIADDSGEENQVYKRKSLVKTEVDKNGDRDENIVILNFEQSSIDEEHLDMVEFVNLNEKVLLLKQKNNDENESKSNDGDSSKRITISIDKPDFKQSQDLKPAPTSHRNSDTPKTFKCPSCPIQFSTENALNRHLKTHLKAGEKGVSFQCPDCGIFVSCKSALTRHMIIHSGVKPFVCEECGKSFIQREILKRHMQTHTGAKPYKCKHCGRSFAQKANLVQHINKNHLEVPIVGQHPCPLCPKRFNHSSGLSRHLATHSGVTFQCTECERTFADRSSVKRHITNLHGVTLDGEQLKDDKD